MEGIKGKVTNVPTEPEVVGYMEVLPSRKLMQG